MADRVAYGSTPENFGDLVIPAGHEGRPIVVLIHGGFWRDRYRLDLMDPIADDLAERGYATWNLEYRRVGPTGGGWDTTTADVAAAIDHLTELGLRPDARWEGHVVIGHSAGGHLALWNASRPGAGPQLTVALAPVADVIAANRHRIGRDATENFLGGNADDVPDRYAHVQPDPDAFTGRVIAIHGTHDEDVPVEQSNALDGRIDRVWVLDGVDHFQVIDPAHATWDIVRAELAELSA